MLATRRTTVNCGPTRGGVRGWCVRPGPYRPAAHVSGPRGPGMGSSPPRPVVLSTILRGVFTVPGESPYEGLLLVEGSESAVTIKNQLKKGV